MVAVGFTLLSTSSCVMNHVPNVYFVLSAALTLFTPFRLSLYLCGLVENVWCKQLVSLLSLLPIAALLMSGEKPLSMRSHSASNTVPRLMSLILSPVQFPRGQFCPVIGLGVSLASRWSFNEFRRRCFDVSRVLVQTCQNLPGLCLKKTNKTLII